MDRKIPFHTIAEILAGKADISHETAETFLKAYFDTIGELLISGETVRVKGLGTFTPSPSSDPVVTFIPDSDIADTLNAPFAAFAPEEIDESVTDEMLDAVEAPEDVSTSSPAEETANTGNIVETVDTGNTVTPEETAIAEETPVPLTAGDIPDITAEPIPTTIPSQTSVTQPEADIEETPAEEITVTPMPPIEETVTSVTEPITPPSPCDTPPAPPVQPEFSRPIIEEDPEEHVGHEASDNSGIGFGWGFLVGILVGLALGAVGTYFAIDYLFPVAQTTSAEAEIAEVLTPAPTPEQIGTDPVGETAPALPDTLTTVPAPDTTPAAAPSAEAATKAAPEVVRDTVRSNYLIQAIAKKHYGHKAFWVYIYEENKGRIRNPNRLQPGQELIIPPASKYNIDAKNPASLKAADERANAILGKYPR